MYTHSRTHTHAYSKYDLETFPQNIGNGLPPGNSSDNTGDGTSSMKTKIDFFTKSISYNIQ